MSLFESTGRVILYLTVAIVGVALIIAAIVYRFRKERLKDFGKYALGVSIGYALTCVVVLTYLKFNEIRAEGAFVPELFYPILTLIIVFCAGGIALTVASMFGKKPMRITGVVFGLLLLGALIAALVVMTGYYNEVIVPGGELPNANTTALIISAVAFAAIIAAIYFIGDKREVNQTRATVYGAIAIAMSFTLSYIKIYEMPQGGAVTLASLLPVMIYCCMFGTRRGVIVCLIYGVLQAIQDPMIIHPMQFLLDYPLAFGLIAISGLFVEKGVFKNKKVAGFMLGAIIAVLLRYACHVVSGVFAFADWANLEKYSTALVYSFAYNTFSLVDMAIAIAAGVFLFASKAFTAQMGRAAASPVSASPSDVGYGDDEDDEIEKEAE